MNGAERLLQTLAAGGVDLCLANPGTSEMALVAALDRQSGIRAVLCLFEGVCTGAADGFGRMADRPALTLLHHGPGFANGIANLHNAWRARSPVLNLVGDHPDAHLPFDAPLTSDLESLARPVSGWFRRARDAASLAEDADEALAAASAPPGLVATLVVPSDVAQGEATRAAAPRPRSLAPPVESARIDAVARHLREARAPALLLGARGLREAALRAAGRIAAATGARLICETFPARLERGGGLPVVERLPYFPEQALDALSRVDRLVLAGAPSPVGFFSYPGVPSDLVPDSCRAAVLAGPREDVEAALEALADALAAGDPETTPAERPERPSGTLDPGALGAALAAVLPEGAVVMEEAATSGGPFFLQSQRGPRHTYLGLTGGSIGQGLPVATGAALACPDRPVVAFQADGGGLYTTQALWTQAREGLRVVNLICANRSYRILQVELARAGVAEPGPTALGLTDLSRPAPDWVALARGYGVPGERVETADALVAALEKGLAADGPCLIEAVL